MSSSETTLPSTVLPIAFPTATEFHLFLLTFKRSRASNSFGLVLFLVLLSINFAALKSHSQFTDVPGKTFRSMYTFAFSACNCSIFCRFSFCCNSSEYDMFYLSKSFNSCLSSTNSSAAGLASSFNKGTTTASSSSERGKLRAILIIAFSKSSFSTISASLLI